MSVYLGVTAGCTTVVVPGWAAIGVAGLLAGQGVVRQWRSESAGRS